MLSLSNTGNFFPNYTKHSLQAFPYAYMASNNTEI